ncbi:MAG: polyprenyl synthetase family protein [Acidimicrobiales bacterium]
MSAGLDAVAAPAAQVDRRLAEVLDEEAARWADLHPSLAGPLEAVRRMVLSGGKRLRPAFCYWGFLGAGGRPDDPLVIDAGAALELLHAFALLHDDVMDGASTRRRLPTIHVEWEERHRRGAWRGDPRRFGEGVAILMGDLAHVYADRLLRHAPADAHDVWHELRIEVNIGQLLDLTGAAVGDTDPRTARLIARYKSGRYTIERPLHLGAALAGLGRLAALREAFSAYGDPLGQAFQLRDDVLGAFGDESLTGKPVGDDLREGKATLLLAIASQRADAGQARTLAQVGSPRLGPAEIGALQEVLEATGARDELEREIERLTAEAIAALDRTPAPEQVRAALAEIAVSLAARRS